MRFLNTVSCECSPTGNSTFSNRLCNSAIRDDSSRLDLFIPKARSQGKLFLTSHRNKHASGTGGCTEQSVVLLNVLGDFRPLGRLRKRELNGYPAIFDSITIDYLWKLVQD